MMITDPLQNSINIDRQGWRAKRFSTIAVSFIAILVTFIVADSSLTLIARVLISTAIALINVGLIWFINFRSQQNQNGADANIGSETGDSKAPFTGETIEKLTALGDAGRIFGSTLRPGDMYRLLTNRIGEIIAHKAFAIFIQESNDGESSILKQTFVSETRSGKLSDSDLQVIADIAEQSFSQNESQVAGANLACPLISDGKPYGAFVVFGTDVSASERNRIKLMDAIGERISPLFFSSFAFEQSLNSSLVDPVTQLPNERALFLVLENQIAESQRYRERRPLSVLRIDIKKFAELNDKFGYATGDRLLKTAGDMIKIQLRQMDFLVRFAADEFIAVLPTVDEATAAVVVNRIENSFSQEEIPISSGQKVTLELNFGTATFMKDGETIADLLQSARVKKMKNKSVAKGTVIEFPKEHHN